MIYTDYAHLFADSLEELHIFAKKIGLKRHWFQNKKYPHYDLTTKRMKAKAIRAGAVVVSTKTILTIIKGYKNGASTDI